jgi:two-component sensor histidine kinase
MVGEKMFFQFNTFGIVLICASIFALYIMYYSYKRRTNRIYYYLCFFALCFFIDAFFQGLDCLTTPFYFKAFCGQICAPGYLFLAPIWLMLVYTISHDQKDMPRKFKIPLILISSILVVVAYSNPWTHLLFSDISLPTNVAYKLQLYYTGTLLYTFIWIYQFLLSIISILVMIKALIKGSKIYRNSYLIAFISSVVAEIIISLSIFNVYPGFSFSITAYLVVFIFLAIAIFVYDAFDVNNIVNKHAINELDIGILTFNNKNLLYAKNPVCELINITDNDINSEVSNVFKNRDDIISFYYNDNVPVKNFNYNDTVWEFKKTDIYEEGEHIGKLLTVNNITDKVLREKELESLSEERKLLLHEIHHRVKNNLQLVNSFLSLDSRYYKNEPERVIRKTQTRIDTMALAHEEVYQSEDVSNINVETLIVNVLSDLFVKLNTFNIGRKYDIKSVFIDIDKAMPLSFLISELATNTIIHAFPDGQEGNFYIELKCVDDCTVLRVWDDGVGLKDSMDLFSTDTLGFTIIRRLTQQLEAELRVLDDVPGFGVELVLPN